MVEHANATVAVRAKETRRAWMNAARVFLGVVSLTAAFWAATYFAVDQSVFIVLLVIGFTVFVAMMLALGRDVAQRWIDFGRSIGFAPALRRPLLEFGTDRPLLHGNAGNHPARLRLVVVVNEQRSEEWLQAELDLFADAADAAVHARANALGARIRDGRLYVRLPFLAYDEHAAREFLAYAANMADAIERPA